MRQEVKFNVVYQNKDGSIEWVVGIGKVKIPEGAIVMERNLMEFVDVYSDTPDIEDYNKTIKRNRYLSGVLYYARKLISPQQYLNILDTDVKLDPDGVMK